MRVQDKHYRTIWLKHDDPRVVCIIDQRYLPHKFVIEELRTVDEMVTAIRDMHLRGAPLIGAAAAYGMYLAALDNSIERSAQQIKQARPTAVNLQWAVDLQLQALAQANTAKEKIGLAKRNADSIADQEAERSRQIGLQGLALIEQISKKKNGAPVNILTHCNAGWLACVDHGTATAPIYEAFERGIRLHVWVDETRPRNQGASLTAWELVNQGVAHTVIADNTGGHLMQHGMVDLVITGADRVTRTGDAANKIGTYLKALAARDNGIPFYVALPSSTFDWNITDGLKDIEIEERSADEVRFMYGLCDDEIKKVLITPEGSPALNYGFDVTPARLITGLITERGVCTADEQGILQLYPENKRHERRRH
ncbi:MAG TPA: S-methyl-5-thioribose-1-phosphate isomerase [Chitinophagaceae bacterium]|nr:S-methyl-5-thioribose-1-phosphate isomerase [Chitinophagaceae bacterium]